MAIPELPSNFSTGFGFLDFFKDLWAPYGKEKDQLDNFFTKRTHNENKISQYSTGSIDSKTYSYDLDNVCSFEIRRSIFDQNGVKVQDNKKESLAMFPNPERIHMNEPTKLEVTELQYGSKVVERGGMVTKALSISGNFGYYPGRPKVAPKGKLPRDGIGSGLFFWTLFTGFFRYFEEIVANDINGYEYFLVYNDHVKQESWIVEPIDISSEQDISKKFMHPYSWNFTVLSPYEPIVEVTPLSLFEEIVDASEKLNEAMNAFERFSGRLEKFILDFVSTVLEPLNNIVNGVNSVISGANTILGIPKATVAAIESQLIGLQALLDGSSDSDGQPLEIDSAIATQNLRKEITKILNTPELFNEESNYAQNESSTLYEAPAFNSETGELMESGENAPKLGTDIVKDGDTVQTIAKRIFGTYSGWEEIVAINKLRPPYIASQDDIDTNGYKNVLAYGSSFTFTRNGKFSQIPIKPSIKGPNPITNENSLTKKMSEFERALGTDIFLDNEGDIEFINNDFKTISGFENIKQQIKVKFSIEKGKLRSDEKIGITNARGRERSTSQFEISRDIKSMVKNDDRFAGASIDSIVSADSIDSKVNIGLAELSEPIPVTIKKDF